MSTGKKIKVTPEFIRSLLDGEKILLKSGKKSFLEGDYDEAIASLNSLLYLDKSNIEAKYFLSAAFKGEGDIKRSKEIYTSIKESNPQEVEELEKEYNLFPEGENTYQIEKAKEFALDFIERYFKEEVSLFASFFKYIKNVKTLDQIKTKNLVGALGITGKVDILKKYKSPIIIKSAIDTFKNIKNPKAVSEEEIIKKFKIELKKNHAPEEVISKMK